ncbi:Protein FAM49A [Eumeta japonica]|uniref:Protein FAM49A n=1 Tax=Eumeta variegata TaxID=151549 RepID=A0A4C1YZC9_EUMVA|nr:Protein FAM49A [Eumeta japonica]
MGKLLSLLSRDDSNCCSSPRYDIFLDFENAAPTDTERDVFEEVQKVLLDSEKILEEIQCYKGAGKEIREAIADPSPISQERAWRAVKPLVNKLLRCYNHSLELQRHFVPGVVKIGTLTGRGIGIESRTENRIENAPGSVSKAGPKSETGRVENECGDGIKIKGVTAIEIGNETSMDIDIDLYKTKRHPFYVHAGGAANIIIIAASE